MKKLVSCAVFLCIAFAVAAEIEHRKLQTEREEIVVSVPREWPATQIHRTSAGKAYFQIGPANTNFSIQLFLNESLQRGTNTEKELERSLEASLRPLIKQSVESKVELVRFGQEGMYGRLRDRAPKAGEFLYYTRGLRVIGTNVLWFELGSNDNDFSALSNTLAVMESAQVARRVDVK